METKSAHDDEFRDIQELPFKDLTETQSIYAELLATCELHVSHQPEYTLP
jgi:hypothetical protein